MIDRPTAYRKQYAGWNTEQRKSFWIQLNHQHKVTLEEWLEIRAALQPLMTPASEKWAGLWRPVVKRAESKDAGVRLAAVNGRILGGICEKSSAD